VVGTQVEVKQGVLAERAKVSHDGVRADALGQVRQLMDDVKGAQKFSVFGRL
jgi:hypothetical protein